MNGKSSSSSSSHQAVIIGSPAAHNTSSSLKSSVKRLFSPKHSSSASSHSSSIPHMSKNQILTAPSGVTTATSSRGSKEPAGLLMTSKPRSLVTSSKSKAESIGLDELTANTIEDGLCSLGGMNSLNDNTLSSCNGASLLSTASHQSKSSNSITASHSMSSKSKATNEILQPRATSTLKKGLNLLKTNSKKVLMGSNSSNNSSSASNSPRKQTTSSIKTGSPTSSTQSSSNNNNEYEQRISDLVTQSRDIQTKCADLQAEIDRLSRLYDYEVGNRVKCEEKLAGLKQAYEERQIESAACKYEYRKLLDLKESLHVENQCLKQALVNYQNSRSNTPSEAASKLKQQINHTSSSSSLSSANNNITNTPRTTTNNTSIVQLISGHQVENDGAYRQPGNFNRSMSPVSAANSSPQSSQSNMMKQQQQAANATAQAAAAAADYFEQQFKAQQHKSQELEQQLCICIDQNKELKETVDNLSELNRKFFEENQQLKERAMSQRDQIDQYHMLFDDNKNEVDQLRDELNQVYQRESDLKRQNMQLLSQIQCSESSLVAEVAKLKQTIEQEKNRADLFEKKLKMLEKESNDLLEQERSEKSEIEVRLRCQHDERLKQERLKLEEKFNVERDEFKKQLTDLEHKLEEVIKEKAQLAFKYGQLVETNRDLNSMVKNSQVFNDKKVEETNNKLEFYINKCNELEKEIAECQETHARDTEEWKKFQADLQTAVRVANDFMMEAEEKVNKMKEDYMKVKEREQSYVEEIDRLKARLGLMETNSRIIQATRQNSTNVESSNKLSSAQLLRSSVETDMLSKSQQSTDTDDAKQIMLSSSSSSNSQRVRTNSSSSSSTASSLSNQDIMIQPTPNVYKSNTSSANTDALATLVKMYDGVSKRNALIKWCQDRLGDYKGIDIKNFSSSWNDGLAFCALLHSFLPHRIDYDSLRLENNPRKNFLTAFQLAQSLGIEQTLSLNDVLNHERPEWSSIMSYVTLIYKHFHQQQVNHLMPGNNSDEEKANLISSGLGSSSSTSSSSSSSPIRNLHSTTSSCAATSSA